MNNPADSVTGAIVQFYSGAAPDTEGRTISEILTWDYDKLEHVHNYIQWLFPTTEQSNYNMHAPVLDRAQIQVFRSDQRLQAQLLHAFQVILGFYGFALDPSQPSLTIIRSATWATRKRAWLQPSNHNFLRISRILTSLRLLGLEVYAQAFFAILSDVYRTEGAEAIGQRTYQYWQRAADS